MRCVTSDLPLCAVAFDVSSALMLAGACTTARNRGMLKSSGLHTVCIAVHRPVLCCTWCTLYTQISYARVLPPEAGLNQSASKICENTRVGAWLSFHTCVYLLRLVMVFETVILPSSSGGAFTYRTRCFDRNLACATILQPCAAGRHVFQAIAIYSGGTAE